MANLSVVEATPRTVCHSRFPSTTEEEQQVLAHVSPPIPDLGQTRGLREAQNEQVSEVEARVQREGTPARKKPRLCGVLF